MDGNLTNFLRDFSHGIVFAHIVSASLTIGSLFFLRFYIKPFLDELKAPNQRYQIALGAIKRFWIFFILFSVLNIISGVLLGIIKPHNNHSPIFDIVQNINELILSVIGILSVWMYVKYKKIQRLYHEKNYIEAHESLVLLLNYLTPLALVATLIVAYFCIILGN